MSDALPLALGLFGIFLTIIRNWDRIRRIRPRRLILGVGLALVLFGLVYIADTTGFLDGLSQNTKLAVMFGVLLFGSLVARVVSPGLPIRWVRLVVMGAVIIGGLKIAAKVREGASTQPVTSEISEAAVAAAQPAGNDTPPLEPSRIQ